MSRTIVRALGTIWALWIFLTAALLLAPFHIALRLTGLRSTWMPRLFHRIVCGALGVRVEVRGVRAVATPTLFVVNHVSWLDIFVLGAQLPAAFVAKSEVAAWPLVGLLARLQPTLFVRRDDRRGAARQAGDLARLLRAHGAAVLFAEGTSSDGSQVLPFRTSLFGAVVDVPGLRIQPVSLAYVGLSGAPVTAANRDTVAWYGDMTLAPHLFALAGETRIDAALLLHPPFVPGVDRKALAQRCETLVRAGCETLRASGGHSARRSGDWIRQASSSH